MFSGKRSTYACSWILCDRLGLAVKKYASKAEDPGLDCRLHHLAFTGSSHTSDLTIGTPVATLPGAWRYRVSAGTGWPGVSILWLGRIESMICNFYLSVATRKIVGVDPSLRYTSMLLGRQATSKHCSFMSATRPRTHRASNETTDRGKRNLNSTNFAFFFFFFFFFLQKRAGAVEDSPANYLFQESGNVKICFVMVIFVAHFFFPAT